MDYDGVCTINCGTLKVAKNVPFANPKEWGQAMDLLENYLLGRGLNKSLSAIESNINNKKFATILSIFSSFVDLGVKGDGEYHYHIKKEKARVRLLEKIRFKGEFLNWVFKKKERESEFIEAVNIYTENENNDLDYSHIIDEYIPSADTINKMLIEDKGKTILFLADIWYSKALDGKREYIKILDADKETFDTLLALKNIGF